jgi:hypothetical protein
MASEVKTNKLSPSTGVTVTLGDASDVFQLPASAEIDIASGATLDVNGTIDVTGATLTGFPAGGITDCSMWRLTTTFTGDAEPITSNLEEDDGPDYVRLGSALTVSSGVFTFPSTGFWKVEFYCNVEKNVNTQDTTISINSVISTVVDTRSLTKIGYTYEFFATGSCATLFDCSNVTTHKVQFGVTQLDNSNGVIGDTNNNQTYFIFTRLADT